MAADRADIPLDACCWSWAPTRCCRTLDNTTPLMAAAGLGTANPLEEAGTEAEALEAVQMLLELGADVNAVDNNGDTAMHGAAYGNFPTVVQLLADRGADINIWKRQDTAGRTPLFIAEGYKAGRPQPSKPTIDVLRRLMVAAGVPLQCDSPLVDMANIITAGMTRAISTASWSGPDGRRGACPVTSCTASAHSATSRGSNRHGSIRHTCRHSTVTSLAAAARDAASRASASALQRVGLQRPLIEGDLAHARHGRHDPRLHHDGAHRAHHPGLRRRMAPGDLAAGERRLGGSQERVAAHRNRRGPECAAWPTNRRTCRSTP